ncbi:MAG: hypothetical protein ACKVP7_10050 [Hyphomicrobiaceae bacterium]
MDIVYERIKFFVLVYVLCPVVGVTAGYQVGKGISSGVMLADGRSS